MKKKIVSVVLLIVLLGCMCCTALADGHQRIFYITKSKKVYLWNAPYSSDGYYIFSEARMDGGWNEMTCDTHRHYSNLASSNSKVAKVQTLKDGGYRLWIKKAGQAVIAGLEDGKEYTCEINVLKYSNPCKSLMIGKKEYAAFLQKEPEIRLSDKKLSGKISVKPSKGWELADIRQGGATHLQNNQKVSLKAKGTRQLSVTFKKTGTNYGCTVLVSIGW